MRYERTDFYNPQDIVQTVASKLDEVRRNGSEVDYLTFVPDGEPTLDIHLGEEIAAVKQLGVPAALISNASLMSEPHLHEELSQLDWISLKIDSVNEATWRKVDRPHKSVQFPNMLEGIARFAETFPGKLTTETMLIAGYNDTEEELGATGKFLERLEPATSYISIPTRPPAEKWAVPADELALTRAYSKFASRVAHVEHLIGYEGNDFAFSGNAYDDILSITAVHPMRNDAVEKLLNQDAAGEQALDQLLSEGRIISADYCGHTYYVRKFREKQMG